jgi:hypothetical protein
VEVLLHQIDALIQQRALPWERDGSRIEVRLGDGTRRQIVHLKRSHGFYRFWSIVAPSSFVTKNDKHWRDLAYKVWRKNDAKDIVGFSFDAHDRLIGSVDQPAETLDPEEIVFYVDLVARECDRFEYRLSGQDRY